MATMFMKKKDAMQIREVAGGENTRAGDLSGRQSPFNREMQDLSAAAVTMMSGLAITQDFCPH